MPHDSAPGAIQPDADSAKPTYKKTGSQEPVLFSTISASMHVRFAACRFKQTVGYQAYDPEGCQRRIALQFALPGITFEARFKAVDVMIQTEAIAT